MHALRLSPRHFPQSRILELWSAVDQAIKYTLSSISRRTLLIGMQGGDGLVAARHLHHFRYQPTIFLPKPGSKDIYQRLLRQCENLKIPVINDATKFQEELKSSDAILDAVFGQLSVHLTRPCMRRADTITRLLVRSTPSKTIRYCSQSDETIQTTNLIGRHPIRLARRGRSSGNYCPSLSLQIGIDVTDGV